MPSHVDHLTDHFQPISTQVDTRELRIILKLLEGQLEARELGAIVEFGCYIGTTSLFIRRLLDAYKIDPAFHVYDSFEGLPEKSPHDVSPAGEQFKKGELTARKKDFINYFKKAGLKSPVIHKGWFKDLVNDEVPDGIMFAFLDGDYYESVMTPLKLIESKLAPGAVVIVDDYANEALPGAAVAVDEWLGDRPYKLRVEQSLAIIST